MIEVPASLFYVAIAIVFILGFIWEIITVIKYCQESNFIKKIIKELERDTYVERKWINEHLETENNYHRNPLKTNDKYILKQYPDIFHQSTRSNLRFISTICTSIGVLGTFYGIQSGIADIPLDSLNQTDALMKGVGTLLAGMQTAFSTSLVGLGLGSVFTIIIFFTDFIRQSRHDNLRQKLHKITVPKKDNREDAINSLKEIAANFRNFDFNASFRAIQALQQVAEKLDAETIGIEVGKAVSIQLDQTIETRLTPAFNHIADSQKTLTQITTTQKNVLENLISEMKNQLIIPVVERLEQSATLTQKASAAVTKLNNELGGISEKLASSIVTIQEFQQQTLGELNSFANSLKSTLHDFQTDTTNVLQETGIAITRAVETSITGMESQREAFQQSATQAAETFSGITSELEQSLTIQSEQQNQMLRMVYSEFSKIITETNESFKTQTITLETVGREASQLMNSAKENLEQTLSNIDETLQNTRVTVQEELQTFRIEYQNSLNQFFNDQNQLLESTLGTQRNALQEVVNDLRNAFQEETQRRTSLMNDLTHTINEVTRGMNDITTATNNMHNRVQVIQELTEAMGFNSGERIAQLQELSRNIGTVTKDFNDLLNNWQNHLNQYIDKSTQWQTKFFDEADDSMKKLCANILENANNALVIIEKERRLN
ncbi:hypothetical protein [Sphaerospermopsis torques-reginae]|uniref:MotA/TolQ/ExbB proton channel domain-containing protein n=1 Tax=Sphaerospermopsis torques-reginae ITEP-024 TaxID=984208 RepID=A0ABX8X480_9CYAN|nr:hypothetical protein [Sphaerospermopsis torques-reginae]QYX33460.1 hypothetical protein K2F26_09165 [Sphaerospermopsis torques-reginae ITEP-024]